MTSEELAAAVRTAVAAEREECARIAESKCDAWVKEADGESLLASQHLYGKADAGRQIAVAIRARSVS